jgi:hypothetical protein
LVRDTSSRRKENTRLGNCSDDRRGFGSTRAHGCLGLLSRRAAARPEHLYWCEPRMCARWSQSHGRHAAIRCGPEALQRPKLGRVSPNRRHQRLDADDVQCPCAVVGRHAECHSSVAAFGSVFIRKYVAPILALIVPKGAPPSRAADASHADFIEPPLYSLQHVLVFPARDPALLATSPTRTSGLRAAFQGLGRGHADHRQDHTSHQYHLPIRRNCAGTASVRKG